MAPFGPAQGRAYLVTQVPRDVEQNISDNVSKELITRDLWETRVDISVTLGERQETQQHMVRELNLNSWQRSI